MHPDLAENLSLDSYSVQTCKSEASGRVEGPAEYIWMFPNLMINRYGK
jgi:hypothetical protein